MTFLISLRRPFNIPWVLKAQKDEPRQDYHWIGQRRDAEQGQADSGDGDKDSQNEKSKQKYRPFADITLGEVDDAYQRFEHQLLHTQENWIGKNYFCQIPLKRKSGYPPMVFGRVKTCYPSDGAVDNVEELELYFPQTNSSVDVLHVQKDDISQNSQRHVQSYFVRVRVFASAEEKAELVESDQLLGANGFYPEFETGYLDLLEMTGQNQSLHPWLYVFGSRWFDTIPDSLREEMKGKLKEMITWGKKIINYHPEWLSNEVVTLNRVLGYKLGFTPDVLYEPSNSEETALIVEKIFQKLIFAPA